VTEETLIRQFEFDPDDNGAKLRGTFRVVRRLYLGDKWFSSGEGEKLALLMLPGNLFEACPAPGRTTEKSVAAAASIQRESIESLISDNRAEAWMRPYITQWGGDVTMRSSALTSDLPQPHLVKGWTTKCGGLLLPSPDSDTPAPTSQPSPAPTPTGSTRAVSILAFKPLLDPIRGEWYCDIEVDANLAYTAMVRLGLAAYQPNSIAGQELSLPIALEPYPLQPRWDVTIRRTADAMEISVAGAAYTERAPGVSGLPGGDTLEIAERIRARAQAPNLQFRLCYADTGVQVVDDGRPVIDIRLAPDASNAGRPVWVGKLPIPTGDRRVPLRVHVSEVITHANAAALTDGAGANPLVTLPTSFSFDATMPVPSGAS
jgi:hypothetical protein